MYLESLALIYQQAGFYQREKESVETTTENSVENLNLDELRSKLALCENVWSLFFCINNILKLNYFFFKENKELKARSLLEMFMTTTISAQTNT